MVNVGGKDETLRLPSPYPVGEQSITSAPVK